MASTETFEDEREIDVSRTLIVQIPTIKCKTEVYYDNDVPAGANEANTEKTLVTNWVDEPPDFKLRLYPWPQLQDKLFTLVTVSTYGKLSAASWKQLSHYYKSITFTDGTYGAVKRILCPIMPYDYQIDVTGKINGSAVTATYYIRKGRQRPVIIDVRKFDISGANLILKVYWANYVTLTDNYVDYDAQNYSLVLTAEPIELQFDMYNSFDKFSAPAFSVNVSADELAGTIQQLANYPFLLAHAESIGVESKLYLTLIAKALHLLDNKGWKTLTNMMGSTKKIMALSASVIGVISSFMAGTYSMDVSIPEHFQKWFEEGRFTSETAILAAATIAAVDNIVLEAEP